MADKKKMTIKDHGVRTMAAGTQGLLGTAIPGTVGLGLLSLSPFLRKLVRNTDHVPPGYKTDTVESLADLADRLSRAGGRNPDDPMRPLELIVNRDGGMASAIREKAPSAGRLRARDFLHASLNATPESVAHEIGHLTHGNRAAKWLGLAAGSVKSKPAMALPSLIAATALLGSPDKDTPLVSKAAPYVGAAQLAALMGEEVRANARGLKLLKDIGYKPSLKQQIGRHAMALPYLARAALLIGAPLGILSGVKAYDKARKLDRPMLAKNLLTSNATAIASAPSKEELQEKWAPLFNNR